MHRERFESYGVGVAERERDLDRLLTFVDAIVAIAVTLLVLPLADLGNEVQDGEVGELLRQHVNDLFGFFLSFVVIARLWTAQHSIVSSLVRQNAAVVRLLLAWSLTIVFLPFPTTLVAGTTNDGLAKTMYIGTMALSSMALALLARLIGSNRHLRDVDTAPDALNAGGAAVAFLLALVISIAFPATGYWPLLLLLLADPVIGRVRRGRAVRSGASPSR